MTTTSKAYFNPHNTVASSPSSSAYSSNYFTRAQKVAIHSFEGKSHVERKSLNKALADDILKTTKHLKDHVNWRQFALMHCPGIIRETSLEGGAQFISAMASLKLLDACTSSKNGLFFSSDNLSDTTLYKLQKALVDSCGFFAFNPPHTNDRTSDVELMKSANAYLDTLEHHPNLSSTGLYLPMGYRHGPINQGHAIVCKIQEQGDEVVVSLFNLGNGSEPHPTVGHTVDQKKTSYSFLPIAIPKKIFFGDLGRTAMGQLLRYLSDAPLKGTASYDGKDIYDIFLQFLCFPGGGRILDFPCPKEEYKADKQISGNCPETAVRYTLEDVMNLAGIPVEERKKIYLNRDFLSLMAGYHAFIENPSCHVSARDLLFDAAKIFGAEIAQLHEKKLLKEEEFIGGSAVVHEIIRAAKKTPYPAVVDPTPAPVTSFNRFFESVPAFNRPTLTPKSAQTYVFRPFQVEIPKFQSMKTLTSDIRRWIQVAKALPEDEVFAYVSDCIRQLPIPSTRDPEDKADPWNEFPKTQVVEVLNLLTPLLKIGLRGETVEPYHKHRAGVTSAHFFDQFLMIHSVYSIADKLARLCEEETKLAGYSCPFLPHPFEFKPLGFTCLPLKEDNERFTAICQYMTGEKYQSHEGYEDKTIFPIAPILDVKQFVKHLLSQEYSRETRQGRDHLRYLAQFQTPSDSASETTLSSEFAKNWMSALPPQVRSLYYFSFLSNVLFSAPGAPFPSSLQFTECESSENFSLKIEDPFFKGGIEQKNQDQICLFGDGHQPKLDAPIQDKRFEFAFQHKDGYNFADLNSNNFKTLTTNAAISYILSEYDRDEWKIDESGFRTLLYDTRKGNLGLWQALQDFSSIENHHLLSHPGVQHALESCFFQHSFLLERLKEEPESVSIAFREFVSKALSNYNDNPAQLEAILFLIRTGASFESYTQKDKTREATLDFYRQTLQKISKDSLLKTTSESYYSLNLRFLKAHLLFVDHLSESASPEQFYLPLFHYNVYESNSSLHSSWITPHLPRMVRNASYKYAAYLEDKAKRNDLCMKILQQFTKDQEIIQSLPSAGWEGDFPEYSCGDFVIDFYHGKIKSKTHKGALRIFKTGRNDNIYNYFTQKHGNLFWCHDKEGECSYVSLNGKLKFDIYAEEWKEVLPNSEGQLHEDISYNIYTTQALDDTGQGFMGFGENFPFIHFKQENGNLISVDSKTNKPCLLTEIQKDRIVYRRLDDGGEKLPFIVAELSKLGHKDPLYRYTIRFANPNEVLCFVDESTNKVHELNFYQLKLHFIDDGKGLAWTDDKDFYLIADESGLQSAETKETYARLREEINQFDGAFILYNPKTKKWKVLFPNQRFSKVAQAGEDFSRNVKPDYSRGGEDFAKEYFAFEFDGIEKTLKPLSADPTRANAYLAILFKMQKSYERAFKYLKQIKTSSFFEKSLLEVLGKFTKINDSFQESRAFNLKFSLFMIRNKNLMLEEQFRKEGDRFTRDFYREFLKWSLENYKLYFNENGPSRTPEALRLSDPEKMMLLLAFRKSFQEQHSVQDEKGLNWEEKWKKEEPELHAQYHVLFAPQKENTFIPPVQEIPLAPPIFSLIDPANSSQFSSPTNTLIWFILDSYKEYHSNHLSSAEQREYEIPSCAVRVPNKAIGAQFVELYNQAKSCPVDELCEFDFLLQTFLKANIQKGSGQYKKALGSLLFWVRHFPQAFKDLPLASPPTEEALDKIIERVFLLPQNDKERYAELNARWKSTRKFSLDPIPLSAPKETAKNRTIDVAKPTSLPPDLSIHLKETEDAIRKLFNSPYKVKGGALSLTQVEQEMLFSLRKDSAQTLSFPKNGNLKGRDQAECLPEVLMKQVILKNNLRYLYKHRPMLTDDQMNELCRLVNQWHHTRVLLKLKEEGKEDLYLPYDYQQYPEISHFYLKTHKFPRKEQLKVYVWIMERLALGIKVHYQLGAGDGKTDFLGPLINLGIQRLGKVPVNCVTQSIYPVDKENLSYNLGLVGEDLCYLEVGVHMINQLSALDLEFIYSQLRQYKAEGRKLICTRHTIDAFALIRDLGFKSGVDEVAQRLKDQKADVDTLMSLATPSNLEQFFKIKESNLSELAAQNPQLLLAYVKLLQAFERTQAVDKDVSEMRLEIGRKIRFAQHIINFFEDFCVLVCDESHQNADPLTRAIFGVGELAQIPENERKQMLEMAKRVLAKRLKSPTEDEIDTLRCALANEFIGLIPNLDLPSSSGASEILSFWMDKNAPEPAILKSLAENKDTRGLANLLIVVKHFLHDLLPDFLSLHTNIDHARSLYPQRKYEVPARNELASTAEYDDKYRSCAFTVKGNYERNLSEDDIRFLLTEMLKKSESEKTQGFSPANTPSNLRFKEWLEKTPLKGKNPQRLEDIVFRDEAQMLSLHEALSQDSAVIDYFLLNYGFEGIGSPSEELFCTTTDVFNGFWGSVSCSATPRDKLANPRCIKEYYEDPLFEKSVRRKWKEPQNSGIANAESREDFFDQMKKGQHLDKTILIDPRGFMKCPNEKVAKLWLENNPTLDGVLYYKQGRSTSVDRDEKVRLRMRDGTVHEISGNDIEAAFKQLNLDWEKLNIGTYYSPGKVESAHIKQKPNAKACFFAGDGLTNTLAIQAMMRCRGFKNANQTVTTFFTSALQRKIFKKQTPTIKGFQSWTKNNQKVEENKRIVLNAFQEIYFAIAKEARHELKMAHAKDCSPTDSSPTMDTVLKVYDKHKKGLVERNPVDAYDALGGSEDFIDSRSVLQPYAKTTYEKFGYDTPYEMKAALKQEIEEIISDLEKRIKKISTQATKQVSKEVEQHLHLKTDAHREQQKVVPRPADPLSLDGVYGSVRIYSPDYLKASRTQAKDLFGTKFLSDGLYLSANHIRTAKLRDALDPSSQYFKPIQFAIIAVTPDGLFAEAESHEILGTEQDDLMACPKEAKDLKHTAFLVAANGLRVQKGKGALATPLQKMAEIMNSTWYSDLMLDIALLNGKITDPDALIQRIKKTGLKDFVALWTKIVQGLPDPARAHTQAFDKLIERYVKEYGLET